MIGQYAYLRKYAYWPTMQPQLHHLADACKVLGNKQPKYRHVDLVATDWPVYPSVLLPTSRSIIIC